MLFSIVCIFEEKPEQWGLRGDPYLWEDMKVEFASVPISVSAEEFSEMFYAAFEKLVKVPLSSGIFPYCSKYAQGGMSSGKSAEISGLKQHCHCWLVDWKCIIYLKSAINKLFGNMTRIKETYPNSPQIICGF